MIRLILMLSQGEDVYLHLFFRIVRILCREPFINRISLRNINVHAQLPWAEEEEENKRKRLRDADTSTEPSWRISIQSTR